MKTLWPAKCPFVTIDLDLLHHWMLNHRPIQEQIIVQDFADFSGASFPLVDPDNSELKSLSELVVALISMYS